MKNITSILLLFISSFCYNNLKAQNCLPNGITLTSQTDIDGFASTYPGCSIIGGNVFISGSDVTNLDSLYNVEVIRGRLYVGSTFLTNFDGLDQLDSITDAVEITSNSKLVNFSGLGQLKFVGGIDFMVRSNGKLLNFIGLDSLNTIASNFWIENNAILNSFEGLSQLQEIKEGLRLSMSSGFVDFEGLNSLKKVKREIEVSFSSNFNSLNGLDSLIELGTLRLDEVGGLTSLGGLKMLKACGSISIVSTGLSDLNGLDSINTISGSVNISRNNFLQDISAIEPIDLSNMSSLSIRNNPQLEVCNYSSICEFLSLEQTVNIGNNSVGCNGSIEVSNACCASDPMWCPESMMQCLPNGITLTSQTDIDGFASTYPGCSIIGGNVFISGSDVTNLDSLYNVEVIRGRLYVGSTFLTNFDGLDQLDSITDAVEITSNSKLVNFSGLGQLKFVGGIDFMVRSNGKLLNFIGLDSLNTIASNFWIENNAILNSFEGLSQLQEIKEGLRLSMSSGFVDFEGLNSLKKVKREIEVSFSSNFSSLNGLDSLNELGTLRLDEVGGLTSLGGLKMLKACGSISIGSSGLNDLEGLDSLTTISGSVNISSNNFLQDISALESIGLSNMSSLSIRNNPQLEVCNYSSICEFLSLEQTVNIGNNSVGCNGSIEVSNACCASDPMWCPESMMQCLPNGITLTSQTDIDGFASTYPGCSIIGGNVFISGSDVTNLDSLYNVEVIRGRLYVGSTFLTNFDGLDQLDSITDAVEITSNSKLVNFSGLGQLKFVGGIDFMVRSNGKLLNFIGLDSLNTIASNFWIENNAILNSFEGLSQLQEIKEGLRLSMSSGFVDFEGLNSLKKVKREIEVSFSSNFNSLNGLDSLIELGTLRLDEVGGLTSLGGLKMLKACGSISIVSTGLSDLNGLDSINTISGSVNISRNNFLQDISAIEPIDLSNMSSLGISNNPQLEVCNYSSICDFLSLDQIVNIGNNSVGCNGSIEVIKDCQGLLYVFDPQQSNFRSTNNFWHNSLNWRDGQIPNAESYVVIVENQTTIIESNTIAECDELIFMNNSNLTIENGGSLLVKD